MDRSINSIRNNLDAPEILSATSATPGADAVKDFLLKKVMDILEGGAEALALRARKYPKFLQKLPQ